jgi:hypothetical protein
MIDDTSQAIAAHIESFNEHFTNHWIQMGIIDIKGGNKMTMMVYGS